MIVYRNRASLELTPGELAAKAEAVGLVAQSSPIVGDGLPGWTTVKHWRERPPHPAYPKAVAVGRPTYRLERSERVSLQVMFAPDQAAMARIQWRGAGVLFCLVAFVALLPVLFLSRSSNVVALAVVLAFFSGGYFIGRLPLLKHCLAEYRRLKAFWRGVVAAREVEDISADLAAWPVKPPPDPARGTKIVFEEHRSLATSIDDVEAQATAAGFRAEFWPAKEAGSLWVVMRLTRGAHPMSQRGTGDETRIHDMVSLEVSPLSDGQMAAKIRVAGMLQLFLVSLFPLVFIVPILVILIEELSRTGGLTVPAMTLGGGGLLFFTAILPFCLRGASRQRRACEAEIERLKGFWESLN